MLNNLVIAVSIFFNINVNIVASDNNVQSYINNDIDLKNTDIEVNLNLEQDAFTKNKQDILNYEEEKINGLIIYETFEKGIEHNANSEKDKSKFQENIPSSMIADQRKMTEANTSNTSTECVGNPEHCNLTKEEYLQMMNDYIYPKTYEWVFIAIHSVVFFIGLVGNALVCIAVYRNHTMRTVTNYFIVNLAVADFMVLLFCLPPTVLWDVTETWFLGEALCKILLYFQSVSVTVSVMTLAFIAMDRWYAICFPLKFKSTTGRAKTIILIIWTVSLILSAPDLVVLTVEREPLRFEIQLLMTCTATWSRTSDLVWHVLKAVFLFLLPLLLMLVAYYQIARVLWKSEKIPGHAMLEMAPAEQRQLRSRRKAAKMLVAVVIMFGVCYFPVHLISVLRYSLDIEQSDVVTFLALISHVVCYLNSAVNPLIYNFMSGKFRREFKRTFCCDVHPTNDSFTTPPTRMTSSRIRSNPVSLRCGPRGRDMCSTTFIANGYRHGYNGHFD